MTGDAADHSTNDAEPEEAVDNHEEVDVGEDEQDAAPEMALCDPAVIEITAWTGCGDGILDTASEECDDGNILDNDGCSWDCRLESGPPREPEASPFILSRYCDVRGPFTLASDVILMDYVSGPVFWWSGSDYRVFFATESTIGWAFTLIACDRDGGNVRILNEHLIEDLAAPNIAISMSHEGLEVFSWEIDEENNSMVGYMSFDVNGDVRIPHTILAKSDPSEDLRPLCWLAHAGGRSEIMVDIFNSNPPLSRVIAFDRASAEIQPCKATGPDIIHYGWCHNLAAEDGSGGYMLAYAPVGAPESFHQIVFPEEEIIPSGLLVRPLCSLGGNDPFGFGMDLEHDGQYFTALLRCRYFDECQPDTNETRVLARFDNRGNLVNAPAIVPLDNCSLCGDGNISFAFGEESIGVFLDCFLNAYFHTLDVDGRYVGEPCEVTDLVGPRGRMEILGVAWDGEGYGVALILDDDIRFYRFLPSP